MEEHVQPETQATPFHERSQKGRRAGIKACTNQTWWDFDTGALTSCQILEASSQGQSHQLSASEHLALLCIAVWLHLLQASIYASVDPRSHGTLASILHQCCNDCLDKNSQCFSKRGNDCWKRESQETVQCWALLCFKALGRVANKCSLSRRFWCSDLSNGWVEQRSLPFSPVPWHRHSGKFHICILGAGGWFCCTFHRGCHGHWSFCDGFVHRVRRVLCQF
mmetsp:Transcript_4304/g.27436  ORF Transcript_4304/g.27436 Transcript_4304/m.27436 type:complete len:222 (-) Transcript_4304:1726-2391(-)